MRKAETSCGANPALEGDVAGAVMDALPHCMKILSPDGNLLFMSKNGQTAMEIDDFGTVEGRLWWDLWPSEQREVLVRAVDRAKQGVPAVFEAPCPTAKGTMKHWRVQVSEIRGGEFDGQLLAASQDISPLVNEQSERKLAEARTMAMSRFSHLVAHELRNPIRQVKLLSELLLRRVDEPTDLREVATQIQSSASDLLELAEALAEVHRMDGTMERRIVSIQEVARAANARSGPVPVTMVARVDDFIVADATMLETIFVSLFDNVVRFAGEAPTASIEILPEPNGIRVRFSDDGPGFDVAHRDEVFQPFIRQPNADDVPGFGLGLAVVERLVGAHGGRCWLERDGDRDFVNLFLPQVIQ